MKGFEPRRQPGDRVGAHAEVPLELGAVYDEYAQRVASWAARLAGPALDPEDLVHEVFLTVHRQLADFRGDAKLSTWLYRITANVVRDRRRQERRRWLRNLLAGREAERAPAGPTPLEELVQRREATAVYQVLDGLKQTQRTLLILFEMEGHSGEEIAELLGIRLETVWVQLHRARQKFQARLERLHPELAAAWSDHE